MSPLAFQFFFVDPCWSPASFQSRSSASEYPVCRSASCLLFLNEWLMIHFSVTSCSITACLSAFLLLVLLLVSRVVRLCGAPGCIAAYVRVLRKVSQLVFCAILRSLSGRN